MSSMKSHNITCKTCGRTNVPDWNGEGDCIRCTRDRALGPTDKNEELREILARYFRYFNKMSAWNVDDRLPFAVDDAEAEILAWHKQAQSDYLERVIPEKRATETVTGEPFNLSDYGKGFNAAIDQIRQNARKEAGE